MIDVENYTDYTVSESFVTAIEYGDFSGIEDAAELSQLEDLIEVIGDRTTEWIDLDSPSFDDCEVCGLKANCVTLRVYENK